MPRHSKEYRGIEQQVTVSEVINKRTSSIIISKPFREAVLELYSLGYCIDFIVNQYQKHGNKEDVTFRKVKRVIQYPSSNVRLRPSDAIKNKKNAAFKKFLKKT